MKYSKYNVVIIGSGASGLFLANKLAQSNNFSDGILLITKSELFSGSSALAQGGIVSVIPELNPSDSVESHINDTLKAGCGLNNINTVKFISQNSFEILEDLQSMGVEFDRNENGTLNFTLEAAHAHPRILHSRGDSTGRVIEEALTNSIQKAANIDIYTHTMAVELLIDEAKIVRGVMAYNTKNDSFEAIYSNAVVLATGGVGQVYDNTTNPLESSGDGIALAHRAGAEIENMEFIQFHPTCLYCPSSSSTPLVSESVRGEGAKLINEEGEYFAKNYDKRADLAPRDVVARAIFSEMERTNSDRVYLDISQIGIEKFKQRFPTVYSLLCEKGIDIAEGLIPVRPAQHYCMGGVKTSVNSKTTLENLYAIGECASSGLHGANRLASNSLLECIVLAKYLSQNLIENPIAPPKKHDEKVKNIIDKYERTFSSYSHDSELLDSLFKKLKTSMSKYCGISRTKQGLNRMLDVISDIEIASLNKNILNSREKFELRFALRVSRLIAQAALNRQESIGAHFRMDSIINTYTNTHDIQGVNNDPLLAG